MNLESFIAAGLAMTALLIGSLYFVSSPVRGAALVLFTYLLETCAIELPPLPFGFNIYPQDMVFALLLIAALWRPLMGRSHLDRSRVAILSLMILVILSVMRGMTTYGARSAGVEARGVFWFFAGCAYFSSFNYGPRMMASLIRLWQLASCVLLAIAMFRWVATGLGLGIASTWTLPDQPAMRVLNSNAAMFLCITFFYSLFQNIIRTGAAWQRRMYYVLGPALLLLQHRTVWVVTLLGIAMLFRQSARLIRKTVFVLAGTLVGATLLIFPIFGTDFVLSSFRNSATSMNDLVWRLAGWYQLLFNRSTGVEGYLIGDPFGAGFSRIIGGGHVEVNPHNFYVETFLRLGILGVGLLVWLYVSQLRSCTWVAAGKYGNRNARLWRIFLVFHLVYFVTYNPSYEQSLILGGVVGGVIHQREAIARVRQKVASRLRVAPERDGTIVKGIA